MNRGGFERVVLEEYPEGVYVLLYRSGESLPCEDHLQDNWTIAKAHAKELGVREEDFVEIPDTRFNG